ncbi:toll/interleukin-1 receptor domain-containing protein [Desulfobulbus rhabdoformis]|uniref:toll/interleukin-1 receptor domain-containing protein n=1 Tax=Desulfobulbus rhabdoformis TaxID=34032 RepID=UPI00196695D0|nr:toll/interleukin-1 receptor domain-containing protein [Desulfobulbus rhabdoformis]MBM9614713.1 toll/interleukin-1 receptor domain-containing protein [Desulfobulbus rhabdoformis]
MDNLPKVFVSYTHEDKKHNKWIKSLVSRLEDAGIDVIYDQEDLRSGEAITKFMSDSIKNTDHVLMICTQCYCEKIEKGTGGINTEYSIIARELSQSRYRRKFIPILRYGNNDESVPPLFSDIKYLDFRKPNKSTYIKLIKELGGNINYNDSKNKIDHRYKYSNSNFKNIIKYEPFLVMHGYDVNFTMNDEKTVKEIKILQKKCGEYEDGYIEAETLRAIDKLVSESEFFPIYLGDYANSTYETPFQRDRRQGFQSWFGVGKFFYKNIPFVASEQLVSFTDDELSININSEIECIHIIYTGAWIYSVEGEYVVVDVVLKNGDVLKTEHKIFDWTWHKNDATVVDTFSACCDSKITEANVYYLKINPKIGLCHVKEIKFNKIFNMYISIVSITLQKSVKS